MTFRRWLQEMEVQDRQQQDNQLVHDSDSDSELDLLQEDQEEVTVLLMS